MDLYYQDSKNMIAKYKDFIEQKVDQNKINYDELRLLCEVNLNKQEEVDINVILPVRDRDDFVKPCINHLNRAIDNCDWNISTTLVEESTASKHSDKVSGDTNYIYVPSKNALINKCLAHNCAFKYSNKAKYYLFHDIDILVQSDFFEKTVSNVKQSQARVLQTFSKRRVLNMNKYLTEAVLSNQIDVNDLNENYEHIEIPQEGAPGGSILVERELFIEIGGYDPELFYGYAPEDRFFWDKIETISKVNFPSDDVELFHMCHDIKTFENAQLWNMHVYLDCFSKMDLSNKKLFLNTKKNLLGA